MSLMRRIALRLLPRLAHILDVRDQLFSENVRLKSRIVELESVFGGTALGGTIAKAPNFPTVRLEDFSVKVFDRKAIPGKKNES